MQNNQNETNESRSLTAENQSGSPLDSKLLSRQQVADRWGVTTHTVARRKDLKAVYFSRRLLRYKLSDIVLLEK